MAQLYNPAPVNKRAVTLFYDRLTENRHTAPIVTAKGEHRVAEDIIAIAREYDIPVFENPGLASLLHTLEIGDEIPVQIYLTIAEIISFAYSLKLAEEG